MTNQEVLDKVERLENELASLKKHIEQCEKEEENY